MYERLVAFDQRLSEQQKLVSGGLATVIGVAAIVMMTFGNIDTGVLKPVLGAVGALLVIVGTLLVGTSEQREQTV